MSLLKRLRLGHISSIGLVYIHLSPRWSVYVGMCCPCNSYDYWQIPYNDLTAAGESFMFHFLVVKYNSIRMYIVRFVIPVPKAKELHLCHSLWPRLGARCSRYAITYSTMHYWGIRLCIPKFKSCCRIFQLWVKVIYIHKTKRYKYCNKSTGE